MPNTNEDRASRGALAAGYVLAVLMPFVGLIVGIVVMFKRRLGHGIAIVALSTLVFFTVLSVVLNETANELDREADRIEREYNREAEANQREYDAIVERANREAAAQDEYLQCLEDEALGIYADEAPTCVAP